MPQLEIPAGMSVMAGRLAFLFWREAAGAALEALRTLRFAEKEIHQAVGLIEVLQRLLQERLPLFDAAKAGTAAVAFAQNAFAALAAKEPEAEHGEMRMLAETAGALCQSLSTGVPLSLRELAVDGNDLRPLLERENCPAREMGNLLSALWKSAVEGKARNRREELLQAAEEWLTIRKGKEP